MKTFTDILDGIIANEPYLTGATRDNIPLHVLIELSESASQEYARQCCEDVLNRAAENATGDYINLGAFVVVDKESITSTEIILP